MGKKYITTPIYYVNAKPHIGHAYTTLAADILARYYRMRGDDVFFQVGTDEHGAKIAEAAKKNNQQPEAYVKEHAALFELAWDQLDVQPNIFWHTHSDNHVASAKLFVERLHEVGALYLGDYEGLYCVGCESFKTEKDLTSDGLCPDHQKPPNRIKEKNWFFRLTEELKQEIRQRIERDELRIQPEHIKKEVLGLLEEDRLTDFSISREKVEWGIPMPPFANGGTMYVWVEALQNYLAAVGHGYNPSTFATWWPPSSQLIGKEIIKFHCIWFPAMLLSLQMKYKEYELAREVLVHGHYTVNGQKMSKTLGNVINPLDLVDRYGSDAARWLIVGQFPYGQDGDIKQDRFDEQYTADLVNGIGNVSSRILGMLEKYNNNVVPKSTLEEDNLRSQIQLLLPQDEQTTFDIFSLPERIREAVHLLDADIARVEPWVLMKSGSSEELDNYFVTWLECLRMICVAITPIMPEAGKNLRKQLACEKTIFEPLEVGAMLGSREQLFPRLS